MLARINGSQPVLRLREEMDKLFGDLLEGTLPAGPFGFVRRAAFPAVNLWEDDQHLYAEAELPGLKMEDLEVLVAGQELTFRGRRAEQPTEGVTFHRRERGLGEFSRVIELPMDIEAEKVQAALRDGVLTITMPKAQAVLPRKIKVQS